MTRPVATASRATHCSTACTSWSVPNAWSTKARMATAYFAATRYSAATCMVEATSAWSRSASRSSGCSSPIDSRT